MQYGGNKFKKFALSNSNLDLRVHSLDILHDTRPKLLDEFLALALIQEECATSTKLELLVNKEKDNKTYDSTLLF
jgi:hypothetical protein